MNVIKPIFSLILIFGVFAFSACDDDDRPIIEKPVGSKKAYPVYNQAYSENFDSDHIDGILVDAKNAYVLIDPFEDEAAAVAAIQAEGNEVGAYISVGTGEDWRDDFQELQPFLVSLQWDEWDGEFFISSTTTGVIDVMKARIDKIAAWGCDWVEFDNMDWVDDEYREVYGYVVTEEEVVAYFQELCDYVHEKGMKCMSKNRTRDAFGFDGVTMESYEDELDWWDVQGLKDFMATGKTAIIIHYNESNCNVVYADYMEIYGPDLSYLCEDSDVGGYVHYNND